MAGAPSGTRFVSGVAATTEDEHDSSHARTHASIRTPALPVCVYSSRARAGRFSATAGRKGMIEKLERLLGSPELKKTLPYHTGPADNRRQIFRGA